MMTSNALKDGLRRKRREFTYSEHEWIDKRLPLLTDDDFTPSEECSVKT